MLYKCYKKIYLKKKIIFIQHMESFLKIKLNNQSVLSAKAKTKTFI